MAHEFNVPLYVVVFTGMEIFRFRMAVLNMQKKKRF